MPGTSHGRRVCRILAALAGIVLIPCVLMGAGLPAPAQTTPQAPTTAASANTAQLPATSPQAGKATAPGASAAPKRSATAQDAASRTRRGGTPIEATPAAKPDAALSREAAEAWSKGEQARAASLWQQLAEQGDAQAMNNLGVLLDQGQGVEPDAGRAAYWFARSAAAGNLSGMSNYGRMLEQGRGIAPDPAEAARWFDVAARQGQPEAQYNLGVLYEHGRGVPRDDKAAAAWYSRAAAQQQRDALARLGHFYRVGRGVEARADRAVLLLHAAAMLGQRDAIAELALMAKENPRRNRAVLFGQYLDEVTRRDMRAALGKAGARATRESNDFICDLYDVGGLVPGAKELSACYGPGKDAPLGFLKIDYAAPDRATAQAIVRMVEERFGKPSAGEGEDSRLWNLGNVVVATQYAPTHRQMDLMYMVPAVYHLTQQP